jgi:hypothetical protein
MPVIVGVPRSGTTLLRFVLDSHPWLAIPPETGFLAQLARRPPTTIDELFDVVTGWPPESPAWPDFGIDVLAFRRALHELSDCDAAEGVRRFYGLYARGQGKPRFGDKTPLYCEHIEPISRLLPEARFIHVIRDGRDVALSLRDTWFAPARDMATLARYWRDLVRGARLAGDGLPTYLEVRYEDLVSQPVREVERVCRFLGLPYDEAMLRYWERTPQRLSEHGTRRRRDGSVLVSHETRLVQQQGVLGPLRPERAFAWKSALRADERAEFERHAAATLADLGYET